MNAKTAILTCLDLFDAKIERLKSLRQKWADTTKYQDDANNLGRVIAHIEWAAQEIRDHPILKKILAGEHATREFHEMEQEAHKTNYLLAAHQHNEIVLEQRVRRGLEAVYYTLQWVMTDGAAISPTQSVARRYDNVREFLEELDKNI